MLQCLVDKNSKHYNSIQLGNNEEMYLNVPIPDNSRTEKKWLTPYLKRHKIKYAAGNLNKDV